MTTKKALEALPDKHREYLQRLKDDIASTDIDSIQKEYRAVARGYIRCLVDTEVIAEFKPIWIWFTI